MASASIGSAGYSDARRALDEATGRRTDGVDLRPVVMPLSGSALIPQGLRSMRSTRPIAFWHGRRGGGIAGALLSPISAGAIGDARQSPGTMDWLKAALTAAASPRTTSKSEGRAGVSLTLVAGPYLRRPQASPH
jgi:hypothetical protein